MTWSECRTPAYIKQLNAAVERERAQRAELERAKSKAARERLTPLQEWLERLLASIPMEIQREGLSLSTLQASLRGRWRGNCHPGELGSALRKLGFKRERPMAWRWWLSGIVVSRSVNRSALSALADSRVETSFWRARITSTQTPTTPS
jgi:hypothetical protein